MTGGIGVATNYIAEIIAVVCAIAWVGILGCNHIIISSDSKNVICDFKNNKVPWFIYSRWLQACKKLVDIQYFHNRREVNFSADSLAKKGSTLRAREIIIHSDRPADLKRVLEMPDIIYYRFCK